MSLSSSALKLLAGAICLVLSISTFSMVTAQQNVRKPIILADFETPNAITMEADGAEFALLNENANHAVEILAPASKVWPGVLFKPKTGSWDLSNFEMVEVDIKNPHDQPVRVLLSVLSPAPGNKQYDNTESIDVPAHGSSTLSLPFGMWHGETGRPIDQTKITAVKVFLDRPKQAHRFTIDNIRAVVYDRSAMDSVFAQPFYQQLKTPLGRGVNLGNALDAPQEGEWGVTLKEEYFEAISQAGFNSVRIPIRWSNHAAASAPYAIEPKFFERVDWAVKQCLTRRLIPVVNVHHYGELMEQPAEHRERFLALWEQIAEHYQAYPSALHFELLNEPQAKLNATTWNSLLADSLSVVRRSNPTRQVVVGPANFNAIDQLDHLQLPADDQHLIVTFHYYSPFNFTHQGAPWIGEQSQSWLGRKWNGSPAEKQTVRRDLDRAIRWGVEHKRPIYMGEFGAYEKADMESRVRWTNFLAEEAIARKIGFAYWEFCSGFGAYNAAEDKWIEPLKQALLPAK